MTRATIYLGTINIKTLDPRSVLLNVDKTDFIWHKDFNRETLKNDIGLIKLPYSVNVTSK